jgi:hypothetical protein
MSLTTDVIDPLMLSEHSSETQQVKKTRKEGHYSSHKTITMMDDDGKKEGRKIVTPNHKSKVQLHYSYLYPSSR